MRNANVNFHGKFVGGRPLKSRMETYWFVLKSPI